jgi:hypothetical protein
LLPILVREDKMPIDAQENRKCNSLLSFLFNSIRRWNSFYFIFNKSILGKCRFGKPSLSSSEGFNRIIEPKLEGADDNTSTTILSTDLPISGRYDRFFRDKETTKATRKSTNNKGYPSQEGVIILPTTLLPANKFISTGYKVLRSGRVEFSVESELPVTTYIMDKKGLEDFQEGGDIYSYGGFTNRKIHHDKLYLDFRGIFYLVIMNEKNEPTAVHWEVY